MMRKSLEYHSWYNMKTRCYNKNYDGFENYGARGITVCDRWRNSFENFYADMGPKPNKDYSLDRINTNGNYEPSNCRWATKSEQVRNQRKKESTAGIKCKSKYKGVEVLPNKNTTYRVRLFIGKIRINIGYFKTEKEAALAYNEAVLIHHGENAYLNVIEELKS